MKSILLVGAGNRCYELFIKPLKQENYSEARIIGVYDINKKRAELLGSLAPYHIPVINSLNDIDNICIIDYIVILTPDYTHVSLITQFLKHTNAHIFCEKPLCTTLSQATYLQSLSNQLKSRISVLLNSRFMPINLEIKRILQHGYIGVPQTINYNWNIDLQHGAEYFRRWHSNKEKSGGLIVHKSCHHFDLLNWWLEDIPSKVSSTATTKFFTSDHDHNRNCRSCNLNCSYRINLRRQPLIQKMYFDAENEDGYIRDKCIFYNSNIHDNINVTIDYQNHTQVLYSINFYSSMFSWDLVMIGEYGILSTHDNPTLNQYEILIDLFSGNKKVFYVSKNNLKHNGADLEIRKILFSSSNNSKTGLHIGSCDEGIAASMIGILSNNSQERRNKCENPFITDDRKC